MKKLLLFAFAAFALAACSDEDNTVEPRYDVISFEKSEGMLDAAEMPVELRDVTIAGDWAGGDFSNVLCGKEYMMNEDFNGTYFRRPALYDGR